MAARSTPARASTPARRRRAGAETRAEIVAAAERHFAESGFEATRLEDVASDVGVRRAAIFYHFSDKQELYDAVLDQVFDEFSVALPGAGGASAKLEAAIEAWVDYVAARPTVARLILREAANARLGVESAFARAATLSIEWFRNVIDEGVRSGELEPVFEASRFLSVMGAVSVFHTLAGLAWLTLGQPVGSVGQDERTRQKQEILTLARMLLGLSPSANPSTRDG